MLKLFSSLVFLLTITGACTSATYDVDQIVSVPNVMKAEITKINDKGKKYDIFIQMTNLHTDYVVTQFKQVQCFRGSTQGEVVYPFFDAGKKMMNFAPRQVRQFTWLCKLPREASGDFRVSLGPVFENPSHDATTLGKKLADETSIVVKAPSR